MHSSIYTTHSTAGSGTSSRPPGSKIRSNVPGGSGTTLRGSSEFVLTLYYVTIGCDAHLSLAGSSVGTIFPAHHLPCDAAVSGRSLMGDFSDAYGSYSHTAGVTTLQSTCYPVVEMS